MADNDENHSLSDVMITEQKVKVGKHFINYFVSKLKYVEPEKTLILLPSILGEIYFMDF